MDLKERLHAYFESHSIQQLDKRVIYVVGVFGILVIAATIWLSLADWRSSQEKSHAEAEWTMALKQLDEPVQSLNRVLFDPQVQTLAVRALENPGTIGDLTAYLNGRNNAISEVRVYGDDLDSLDPLEMGANGFALLDMLLTLKEGRFPQLQMHHSIQPTVMVDAIRVSSGDEFVGYLVIFVDPEYVLSRFNPEFSNLGYIALSQYNGRQKASILRQVGDYSLVGDVPERHNISGTRFRIDHPMLHKVTVLEGSLLFLFLFVGALFIIAAALLHHLNKSLPPPKALRAPAREQSERKVISPAPDQPEASMQHELTADKPTTPEKPSVAPDPPPMRLRYDLTERRKMKEHEHEPVVLQEEIFRAYDIRGVIDKSLDAGVAKQIGQAIGSLTLEREGGPVVVARDGRLSGEYLQDGMIEGILSTGCDVMDIGAVPTGVLYYAAHELADGSGVMITGSHNPPDYNGFKVMVAGDTLHGRDISGLYQRIVDGNLKQGSGVVTTRNVVPDYIERIAGDIQLDRPLKVVIDCGNGIGGVCAADVLRAIGAEVLPLFDEVDGTFPNHHPDPSEPENLTDLIESVRLMDADLGLALDGDADRLGVVTLAGTIIFPDRIMMLLAMDVLDRHPGATILYDVKCTNHLADVIQQAGGVPMMYKTGHSLIKAKMKEIGSPFAGEMSGHFFFKDRWYGVDDGIYSAARLLEILASAETPPEAILNALPTSFSTPELKVQMKEGENFQFMDVFSKVAKFLDAEVSTIDGIRADFDDGWGLVRCSNTTPVLVIRFDAESESALERIKNLFRTQMLAINPDLDLPF